MNFTPVEEIGPYKRVDIIGILTDIQNSPYDTVMLNEDVVTKYASPIQCRSAFATCIKRRGLNNKLKACMRSGKIYICKIKEG